MWQLTTPLTQGDFGQQTFNQVRVANIRRTGGRLLVTVAYGATVDGQWLDAPLCPTGRETVFDLTEVEAIQPTLTAAEQAIFEWLAGQEKVANGASQ